MNRIIFVLIIYCFQRVMGMTVSVSFFQARAHSAEGGTSSQGGICILGANVQDSATTLLPVHGVHRR